MKKELVQYLFEASNNNHFKERFQSFLDQIPQPTGSTVVPAKDNFFTHFFLGMLVGLKSAGFVEELGVKNMRFEKPKSGKTLHAIITFGSKELRFAFSESKTCNALQLLKDDQDNDSVKTTKVLVYKSPEDGSHFEVAVNSLKLKNRQKTTNLVTLAHTNIEGCIKELGTTSIDTSQENIAKILTEAKKLYLSEDIKKLIGNDEAAQHGFLSGLLMNFRYRHNLKLLLELITGRGFADIMLLVRGEHRSGDIIPIIIELKSGTGNKKSPEDALEEAKEYSMGLYYNKLRLLTAARKVLCVGVNFDFRNSYSLESTDINQEKKTITQQLFDKANNDNRNEKEIAKDISDIIARVNYIFPSPNRSTKYLSRFLLGQLCLIEGPSKGITEVHVLQNEQLDLFTYMVTSGSRTNKKVIIFHIDESNKQDENYTTYSFSKDAINNINIRDKKTAKITLVDIKSYRENDISPKFAYDKKDNKKDNQNEYKKVKIKQFNSYEKFAKLPNQLEGTFSKVPSNKISDWKDDFEKSVKYHVNFNNSITNDYNIQLGSYQDLFKKVKTLMWDTYFKSRITNEAEFKASLDGLFTGLSNLKKDGTVFVITEYQVGRGGRADIVMQLMEKEKGSIKYDSALVGFELKHLQNCPKSQKPQGSSYTAEHCIKDTESQISRYLNSKNIKSLTDARAAAFIAVVFDQEANKDTDIITTSENFICASVQHSSMEEAPAQQQQQQQAPGTQQQHAATATTTRPIVPTTTGQGRTPAQQQQQAPGTQQQHAATATPRRRGGRGNGGPKPK